MKILITGATGFIGYNLVRFFKKQGHDVSALVRKPSKIDQLLDLGIKIFQVDFESLPNLKKSIIKADALIHLASLRGEWGWTKEEYQKTNIDLVNNLLEASLGKVDHFIYCSSVSVLGHFAKKPANETYPYAPVNNYGQSKCEAEKNVLKFCTKEGLPATIIRPVITYGPYDYSGMLTKLITLINSAKYLTVGNGKNRVHLLYIDDLLQGFNLVLQKLSSAGEIVVFAGNNPITINDLVEIISTTLNKKIPRIKVPRQAAKAIGFFMETLYKGGSFIFFGEPLITRSKVDIMTIDRCYDISKAKSLLGFEPLVNYEQGVRSTINWLERYGII